MNIILLKRKKGSSGFMKKNHKLPVILFAMLVVLPATFIYSGYRAGYHVGISPVYSDRRPNLFNRIIDPEYKYKYENRFENYKNQMNALGNVQMALDDLKIFVANHETKLKTEQDALEHILKQKQTLKPLLSADQEIIDALFTVQAEKMIKQKWIDRAVGFVSGLIASLVAAILIIIIQRKYFRLDTEIDKDKK